MQKRNVSIAVSCALMWGTAFAESAYIAPLADQSLLLDIEKVSDDKLVTVGERGHILIKQGTGPWQQQVSPTSQMLTAVTFKGDQLGWAVGHDAVILHTQDGGNNWSIQLNQPDLEKPLMDIHFFDQQHGIAIGAYGLFYRTLDGGKNWQKELHGELLPEEDQDYLNELREEDESLYVEELSSILPHLNQLSEEVAGRIFLAGEMGLLAVSEDQGHSWQRMDVDYYGSFFTISQTPQQQVLAAGLRGNVYRFDGSDWQAVDNEATSSINAILPISSDETLLVGNSGVKINITDRGVTTSQTEEGQAIVDAVTYKGEVIAATEAGITVLQKK